MLTLTLTLSERGPTLTLTLTLRRVTKVRKWTRASERNALLWRPVNYNLPIVLFTSAVESPCCNFINGMR